MPHSHTFGKDHARPWYVELAPERVVELGPGAGMWSRALRRFHRGYWIGVEIWRPYVAKYRIHRRYDEIHIGDARTYPLPEADLVIAGDILEHMLPEEAADLVDRILASGAALLVSVPIIHYEQGALEGNPHETHLWHPSHELMMEWLRPDHYATGTETGVYWIDK